MKKFTQHTLDRIKYVAIEDVASDLDVEVKNHKCKCPFHEDHHPSMKFWPSSNTCKCFVCDKTFDQISLVQEKEGISFFDACLWIADHNNIYVEYEDDSTLQKTIRKPKRITKPTKPMSQPVNIQFLDSSYIAKKRSNESPFCKALVSNNILTPEQMQHAAERYHLGISHDNGVIFWQIDEQRRLREGKIMFYLPNCHRDHNNDPSTISSRLKKHGSLSSDWSASYCLFGLHLVTEDSKVAIVESEKTAIICSELLPDFAWVATGGSSFLTTTALQPLALLKAKIIIFPDTDSDGTMFNKWKTITEKASKALNIPIYISNLLELHATPDQKSRKIDIADFLIENR